MLTSLLFANCLLVGSAEARKQCAAADARLAGILVALQAAARDGVQLLARAHVAALIRDVPPAGRRFDVF